MGYQIDNEIVNKIIMIVKKKSKEAFGNQNIELGMNDSRNIVNKLSGGLLKSWGL